MVRASSCTISLLLWESHQVDLLDGFLSDYL